MKNWFSLVPIVTHTSVKTAEGEADEKTLKEETEENGMERMEAECKIELKGKSNTSVTSTTQTTIKISRKATIT
jgi:hypothetical protein